MCWTCLLCLMAENTKRVLLFEDVCNEQDKIERGKEFSFFLISKVVTLRCYYVRLVLKIGRSFQLGINGDRAPCVSVLAMPVEPIILEPFALESRRLCVAPPGRRSRLRCSGDLPPQRRTVSRPCLSWRAKGPDSSTQLPIVWSMMPSETERGEGEATRARIGAFRSSQGPPGQRRLRKHPTCELPPLD